jgi:hypothetical protein
MGWLGFLVGKRRGGDAVAAGVKWERRRGSAATGLGCEICAHFFLDGFEMRDFFSKEE